MNYKENILNDKTIGYFDTTEFLIQIGRGKSAYRTRYKVVGNLAQAVHLFNGLNVGYGYKKRLFVPSFTKPILARVMSLHTTNGRSDRTSELSC